MLCLQTSEQKQVQMLKKVIQPQSIWLALSVFFFLNKVCNDKVCNVSLVFRFQLAFS